MLPIDLDTYAMPNTFDDQHFQIRVNIINQKLNEDHLFHRFELIISPYYLYHFIHIVGIYMLAQIGKFIQNRRLMLVLLALQLLLVPTLLTPELLNLADTSSCVRNVVEQFVTSSTCATLGDSSKSKLALQMMNCLLAQMGKPQVTCSSVNNCDGLKGESWNTFTTFYAHIDNLCHFYWDISKAERAEQMVQALVTSAEATQQTLKQNNDNTIQILQLQNSLKLQILASLTSQEQMRSIINSSSSQIQLLTSSLQQSLNQIHEEIGIHYNVINKVLSGINRVLDSLMAIEQIFVSETTSVKGLLYFIMMILLVIVGCLLSVRVQKVRNQLLVLIGVNFLVEYFFGFMIVLIMDLETLRFIILVLMGLMMLMVKVDHSAKLQKIIEEKLTTDRLKRILDKSLHSQIKRLTQKPQ